MHNIYYAQDKNGVAAQKFLLRQHFKLSISIISPSIVYSPLLSFIYPATYLSTYLLSRYLCQHRERATHSFASIHLGDWASNIFITKWICQPFTQGAKHRSSHIPNTSDQLVHRSSTYQWFLLSLSFKDPPIFVIFRFSLLFGVLWMATKAQPVCRLTLLSNIAKCGFLLLRKESDSGDNDGRAVSVGREGSPALGSPVCWD